MTPQLKSICDSPIEQSLWLCSCRALGSGKSSNSSQLKLVKRDGRPCLCFETKAHESALSIDITHDIPIKVDYKYVFVCADTMLCTVCMDSMCVHICIFRLYSWCTRQVIHICLQVLKVSDMAYHLPPVMRAPTVALDLPRSKLMKTVETTTTALFYLLSVCVCV